MSFPPILRSMLTCRIACGLSIGLLIGSAWAEGMGPSLPPISQGAFTEQIKPQIKQFCEPCHTGDKASAGLNLTAFPSLLTVQKEPAIWRKVIARLQDRSMPPAGSPQPTQANRDQLTLWLTRALTRTEIRQEGSTPVNPGRVLIHRLSRLEYNNTVRDLLGVASRPADKFPADGGGGGGFDNNADTLFVPPILMERYLETAGDLLNVAPASRIFIVHPGHGLAPREAAQKIVARFAERAYRRPVDLAEVARLMRLYDMAAQHGSAHADAVKFACKAVLISPNFLFRAEQDRGGANPALLDDYELANRLSYFLWASMPDDTLFTLAKQKRLHTPGVLAAQVRRMLHDDKARALADGFAAQWLKVKDLYTTAQPDPGRFPEFTPTLREAMYQETTTFFQSLMQEDASLLKLLDSDYTYCNEELAKHYGLSGVKGTKMQRVSLPDARRGGVLSMASVLTLTSYPQRTSPVLRGKWTMETLLGATIPPPPANVATLPADDNTRDGLTFRQQLEKHRSRPECASCHSRMDPLGFGLENYDAVGRWRAAIGEKTVDASGVLTSGEKFSGPVELKKLLLQHREDFIRNITERMLSYALGRGLEPYDQPTVRKITATLLKNDCRASLLALEIAKSYPFQYRKSL